MVGSVSAPLSLVGVLPCSARGARQTGLAQSGKPLPALPHVCFAARTGRDSGPRPIQKAAACAPIAHTDTVFDPPVRRPLLPLAALWTTGCKAFDFSSQWVWIKSWQTEMEVGSKSHEMNATCVQNSTNLIVKRIPGLVTSRRQHSRQRAWPQPPSMIFLFGPNDS